MSVNIYFIYDRVAESCIGSPFSERHHAPAIRAFHGLLANKETSLAQHPLDYSLKHVATVSDEGRLMMDPEGEVVATGEAWVAAQQAKAQKPVEVTL